MSEDVKEAPVLESKATPEQRKAAEEMGWIPPERFKGDPSKFIDADVFLERGETIMPILKKTNERLRGELADTKGKLSELERAIKESQETIKALQEFHSAEVKRRVEETKKELLAQLKAAREQDDVDAEVQIVGELTKLNAAEANKPTPPPPPPPPPQGQDPTANPEWKAWVADNPWFGSDMRRTRLAQVIASELRSDPANAGLTGRAFLDKVSEQVEETLGAPGKSGVNKVEGARGSGPSSGRRTFADLPAEAREACHSFANRLVGPSKPYKTLKEWEDAYTRMYYEGGT